MPQVRAFAQSMIKPGMVLEDFCNALENKNRELIQENGLEVTTNILLHGVLL